MCFRDELSTCHVNESSLSLSEDMLPMLTRGYNPAVVRTRHGADTGPSIVDYGTLRAHTG